MTEIILQVQGAEPRCFLLEIEAYENPSYMIVSVWALSAFDALEQGRLALPRQSQWIEPVRGGKIARVALCPGGAAYRGVGPLPCDVGHCSRKHERIGVIT